MSSLYEDKGALDICLLEQRKTEIMMDRGIRAQEQFTHIIG